jgi:CubicO group peptidase (beta-lactamase class C family)
MMRVVLLTLCATLVFSGSANAGDGASVADIDAAVSSISERLVQASEEGASGILRIKYGENVLIEKGFGSASCTINEDVTSEHVFMIGSITKEFTRVLGFVLEEKGVFTLEDPVSEILAGFRGPIGRVTLKQLVDHTGGLPDLIDQNGQPVQYTVEYDYEPVSRDELIARAGLAKLVAEPGENEQYSNLGYQLLAAIYEVATGVSYPDLLRRNIYGPAKMSDTDFWFSDSGLRSFADGCRANNQRWGNPVDDEMWDGSGPSWNLMGAGGLLSTAESLGRFLEGIGAGVYFDDPMQLEKYKLSRMVFSKSRQQRVMGPAGSNGIFNAVAVWADDDQLSVILMTNRADHPAEGGLIQDIMKSLPPNIFAGHDND